ncbi:RES family NAD+ phosphorylase [Pseudomonas chlororaphis]|uniref:RES domain-containing protein n=1 Tax=Pseudomonas chlororaphis TaxID=587753 RepID=A0A1Q8EPU9_9PSED|nr:RES family NAD+ phosphorylase [Pseudomonas chlororaphis]OLF53827.1 hypothetical protein BTN82_15280 [Pseudomonas chlororaphis]
MARRKGTQEDEAAPDPAQKLEVSMVPWRVETPIHRIHQEQYEGDQFNPGIRGNARFSPIKNAQGDAIPTLYGGSSFDCAAMETVFHDVSYQPGPKIYDKNKLTDQRHAQLVTHQTLDLVDLRSVALHKLGVRRNQLIDTEKDQYPRTRLWAEAIHAQCPKAQGLLWTSRQDDSAQAVMLFGDRIEPGTLEQNGDSFSLVTHEETYEAVLDLAQRIGVDVIPGNPLTDPPPTPAPRRAPAAKRKKT